MDKDKRFQAVGISDLEYSILYTSLKRLLKDDTKFQLLWRDFVMSAEQNRALTFDIPVRSDDEVMKWLIRMLFFGRCLRIAMEGLEKENVFSDTYDNYSNLQFVFPPLKLQEFPLVDECDCDSCKEARTRLGVENALKIQLFKETAEVLKVLMAQCVSVNGNIYVENFAYEFYSKLGNFFGLLKEYDKSTDIEKLTKLRISFN